MKTGVIVQKLKLDVNSFGDRIAGAADFMSADEETLKDRVPCAWVIQYAENAEKSASAAVVSQRLTENFAVLVAIRNDSDETGFTAHTSLFDLRAEIWSSILGWKPTGFNEAIEYLGGSIYGATDAILVYQFNFTIGSRITDEDGYTPGPFEDFLKAYGLDDLVVNGGFDVDSGWTKGASWSIVSGVARCDGMQLAETVLEQVIGALEEGTSYSVSFKLSNVTAGSIKPILGGTEGTSRTIDGSFSEAIVCGSSDTKIQLVADADFKGDVDAVVVGMGYGIDFDQDGRSEADFTQDLPGP